MSKSNRNIKKHDHGHGFLRIPIHPSPGSGDEEHLQVDLVRMLYQVIVRFWADVSQRTLHIAPRAMTMKTILPMTSLLLLWTIYMVPFLKIGMTFDS